jgi:hypothetical protein
VSANIPDALREKIRSFPESSMGANRVRVRLRDGREFSDVYVAWGKEIVRVGHGKAIPFDPSEIEDVENQL